MEDPAPGALFVLRRDLRCLERGLSIILNLLKGSSSVTLRFEADNTGDVAVYATTAADVPFGCDIQASAVISSVHSVTDARNEAIDLELLPQEAKSLFLATVSGDLRTLCYSNDAISPDIGQLFTYTLRAYFCWMSILELAVSPTAA